MKGGRGRNSYHLNEATMINILNSHIEYSTDQVVVGVAYNSVERVFVVSLEDKPAEQKS